MLAQPFRNLIGTYYNTVQSLQTGWRLSIEYGIENKQSIAGRRQTAV